MQDQGGYLEGFLMTQAGLSAVGKKHKSDCIVCFINCVCLFSAEPGPLAAASPAAAVVEALWAPCLGSSRWRFSWG